MPIGTASGAAMKGVRKKDVLGQSSSAGSSTNSRQMGQMLKEASQKENQSHSGAPTGVVPTVSIPTLKGQAWAVSDVPSEEGEDQRARQERLLNKAVGCIILLNAVMLGVELDYAPTSSAPKDRIFWFLTESMFTSIFMAEILIRMYWEGHKWPFSPWNWLDTFVVTTSAIELWLLSLIQEGGNHNLGLLTLLRIFRLVRLVRVIRLVRMFRGLYVTLMAFKEAVSSIGYISLLMLSGIYICSIFTTTTIGRNEELRTLDMGGYTAADRFGTVRASMYSLFELMTLEGWQYVGRPLVTAQPAFALFLFAFILTFTFGMLNMIVAMVVEKTIQQARKADEADDQTAQKSVLENITKLTKVFVTTDDDCSGLITRKELAHAISHNEELADIMKEIGMPVDNTMELFAVLDDDDSGTITKQELFEGCARIIGASNPEWDLLVMSASIRYLVKKVGVLEKHIVSTKDGTVSAGRFSLGESMDDMSDMSPNVKDEPNVALVVNAEERQAVRDMLTPNELPKPPNWQNFTSPSESAPVIDLTADGSAPKPAAQIDKIGISGCLSNQDPGLCELGIAVARQVSPVTTQSATATAWHEQEQNTSGSAPNSATNPTAVGTLATPKSWAGAPRDLAK